MSGCSSKADNNKTKTTQRYSHCTLNTAHFTTLPQQSATISSMDSYPSSFETGDFETFGPTCHRCFKEYSSSDALGFHLNNLCEYRQSPQEPAKAPPRQFQTTTYQAQPESAHSSHVCQICNRTFNNKITSIAHTRDRVCIPSADRPYGYDYCASYFKSRSNLAVHRQSVHEGKWRCRVCDKTLTSGQALRRHEETNH